MHKYNLNLNHYLPILEKIQTRANNRMSVSIDHQVQCIVLA